MHGALAIVVAFLMAGQPQQQQNVPDAPTPQSTPQGPLGDIKSQVAPGTATTPDSNGETPSSQGQTQTPPPGTVQAPPPTAPQEDQQQEPPELPPPGQGTFALGRVQVTEVLVPVTVRDSKHNLVAGLTWRDFRVFENGRPQHISLFTVDPQPLSVALVIDQSVPADTMDKVNQSLAAVTGAFGPADAVAVFTYNKFIAQRTEFTAAQGTRLPMVLAQSKSTGRDAGNPDQGGPLSVGPTINNKQVDPNLAPQRGNAGIQLVIPKEVHPLNDALLQAATELAKTEKGRRRIIYIVSDGKEYGSKATYREVVQYMLRNNITVYGTLVGDSATWGLGYLDKFHLPLLPTNNILPKYTTATGGGLEAEFSSHGIEKSFSEISASIRTQYLMAYTSHEPVKDGKFREIEVKTPGRPGLEIDAKRGYYPTAVNSAP
jgi:VWFA-related protein